MAELSVFVDESGSDDLSARRYLVTLVLHDQGSPIDGQIARYEEALRVRGLPNIPFHASPLMNGRDGYEGLPMADRKRLLAAFFVFVRSLPVRYRTLTYLSRELGEEGLLPRMERDVRSFISDNLAYFQGFDMVKVYYDGGQSAVTRALHGAVESMLSAHAYTFRKTSATQYRLSQVADFICTVELCALKYGSGEQTSTDGKVFGTVGTFKKNYLRKVRRLAV